MTIQQSESSRDGRLREEVRRRLHERFCWRILSVQIVIRDWWKLTLIESSQTTGVDEGVTFQRPVRSSRERRDERKSAFPVQITSDEIAYSNCQLCTRRETAQRAHHYHEVPSYWVGTSARSSVRQCGIDPRRAREPLREGTAHHFAVPAIQSTSCDQQPTHESRRTTYESRIDCSRNSCLVVQLDKVRFSTQSGVLLLQSHIRSDSSHDRIVTGVSDDDVRK